MFESDPKATVVTACDSKFVWGAILLGLSLRYHKMNCYFHVLGYDLSQDEINFLESIPETKVYSTHKPNTRSVCTQKPIALALAETEIIVWMDSDCLATGNLDKFFHCCEDSIQIRWRGEAENATVYRNFYHKNDRWGAIPKAVLDTWKQDVGDLDTPQIQTVCQTNCFVIRRQHLDFIEQWHRQMDKVIPIDTVGVYAKHSPAYSMTDESVLNSLFAFSSHAPKTCQYQMDTDPEAYCLHFGLSPKPWEHWSRQSLKHYKLIMNLLIWAKAQGMKVPVYPKSFRASNYVQEKFRASLEHWFKKSRYHISSSLHKLRKAVS